VTGLESPASRSVARQRSPWRVGGSYPRPSHPAVGGSLITDAPLTPSSPRDGPTLACEPRATHKPSTTAGDRAVNIRGTSDVSARRAVDPSRSVNAIAGKPDRARCALAQSVLPLAETPCEQPLGSSEEREVFASERWMQHVRVWCPPRPANPIVRSGYQGHLSERLRLVAFWWRGGSCPVGLGRSSREGRGGARRGVGRRSETGRHQGLASASVTPTRSEDRAASRIHHREVRLRPPDVWLLIACRSVDRGAG
jgi:hypothetical protein